MATYSDRQSFIPFRRADVIELCIEDSGWKAEAAGQFRAFCEILTAYHHFRFQSKLENLKNAFAPFDPDADTKPRKPLSALKREEMEEALIADFVQILRSANYQSLSESDLKNAFLEESLIPLNTDVDFSDFENGRLLFFHRGLGKETVLRRRFFRKKEHTFDVFERVVLLLKFKGEDHFKRKKKKLEALNFSPGKLYIYLYKKIPKYDLDILFPNVDISMTWRDLIRFGVPAVGALVPIGIKALPNIILIIGVILYFTVGPGAAEKWGANEQALRNTLPIITAILSLGFVLGSYAAKQYLNYKNKRLQFLKTVTDTLFFKNMDCNAGVLHRLVDEAEEEECKEMVLVYHFLLSHPGLTEEQIDDGIERWMEEKFKTRIDFNIRKALDRLKDVRGKVGDKETSLLSEENGFYRILPLSESKILIDHAWDNVFIYNVS